jgi:hypothetical protein
MASELTIRQYSNMWGTHCLELKYSDAKFVLFWVVYYNRKKGILAKKGNREWMYCEIKFEWTKKLMN